MGRRPLGVSPSDACVVVLASCAFHDKDSKTPVRALQDPIPTTISTDHIGVITIDLMACEVQIPRESFTSDIPLDTEEQGPALPSIHCCTTDSNMVRLELQERAEHVPWSGSDANSVAGRNPWYVSSRGERSPTSSPRVSKTLMPPSSCSELFPRLAETQPSAIGGVELDSQQSVAADSPVRVSLAPRHIDRFTLVEKHRPFPWIARTFSAPSRNIVEPSMGTQDHADFLGKFADASTHVPSDYSGEDSQFHDGIDLPIEQLHMFSEGELSLSHQDGDSEDGFRIDLEHAVSTTTAAIEAFVAWLKASGQAPRAATLMLTDLPREANEIFSRITCLVSYQTSLPSHVVFDRLWQRIVRELRGEENNLANRPFF